MLPHRSDTSRGHLHPPTRPRLTLPPAHSLVLSFSLLQLRLGLTPHRRGGFSRAAAYAATFLGALARLFLPPSDSTTSLQLPGPPLATPPPSSTSWSYRSTMQRPLSTRQIFPPPSGTTLRPVGEERRLVYTIFGTSDRTIESIYVGDVLEKNVASVGRGTDGSDDRGRFARSRKFQTFFRRVSAFTRKSDFSDTFFRHAILFSRVYVLSFVRSAD